MPVIGAGPRDPVYLRIITDLKDCKDHDLRIAMMRKACEKDFWLFCKLVSSFGRFKIEEKDHPTRLAFPGKDVFWIDEQFVFDRCRELQNDAETRADNVAYNWSRFMFKTELITKLLTLWEICQDSSLTVAIICFKVEELGEKIVSGIKEEISANKTYHELWPNVFAAEDKDYPLFTTTALTLLREPGPKEATISVHSINAVPASGHFRRIIKDDCVVAQVVETQRTIKKAIKQMRRITAVRSADTIIRNVFTIWDNEDPNMVFLREGAYSRRSLFPAMNEDGTANLRSLSFWKSWSRELGPYETSCQLQQKPVAKGDQHFLMEWLDDRYEMTPRRCRDGKIVHVFTDFSQEKDWSDPVVFRVVGLGVDKKKYQLDLYREKIGFAESIDLLFDVCRMWNVDGYVWFEKNSNDMYRAVRLEQVRRSDRSFTCKMLPDKACQRPKERRIMLLQGGYRRGDYVYPRQGFGHGSKGDNRDTLQQFISDEYVLWTPEPGSTLHDDLLDTEAWCEDPEVNRLLRFPKGKLSVLHEIQNVIGMEEYSPANQRKTSLGTGWAY